uniref:tumor necrosis factor receptor superfamily member 6B n=1 Tax=Euleptes europaea TaxID=460621 RepID=UPI002540A4A7|nr:tumor necrosis factor receptor superfamily member 6B [Euleptes europaea]
MPSYGKKTSVRKLSKWMVCSLLVFWNTPVSSSNPTYEWQDPITHQRLVCQQCPPGTFMAQHCTKDRPTQCQGCPTLHYTQYWNYLDKCLYCNNICSSLEVEARPCNATHDRVCQCKPGYYLNLFYDYCMPHSTCPLGSEVAQPGTPHEDTKCAECLPGTFSNSSTGICQPHTNCSEQGLELIVPGNQFHDALCTACKLNQTKGPLERLEEGSGRHLQPGCPVTKGQPSGDPDCEQAFIGYVVNQITSLKRLRHLKRVLEQGSLPKEGHSNQMQLQAKIYSYLTRIRNTPAEESVTKELLVAVQSFLHRRKDQIQKRFSLN